MKKQRLPKPKRAGAAFLRKEERSANYEKLYHLMVRASEAALATSQTGSVWDAQRILIKAEGIAEDRYVESGD